MDNHLTKRIKRNLEKERKENKRAGKSVFIVLVEPDEKPTRKIIDNTVEGFQHIVGGYFEAFLLERTANNGRISLVYNEDGLNNKLPSNRLLVFKDLRIDLKGAFFITKTNSKGETCDLTDAEAQRYITKFDNDEIRL